LIKYPTIFIVDEGVALMVVVKSVLADALAVAGSNERVTVSPPPALIFGPCVLIYK
jgi:hypothetical protein